MYHIYSVVNSSHLIALLFVQSPRHKDLFKCSLESRNKTPFGGTALVPTVGGLRRGLNIVSICVGYTPPIVISILHCKA